MVKLDDYEKVQKLSALFKYLDWLREKVDDTEAQIKALGANMTASDIKYAVKESEK